MEILLVVLEAALTVAAYLIYGTKSKPRPPLLRFVVRVIAFGGLPIALAWMSFWSDVAAPIYVILPWALSVLIVLLAENDLGSKRLAHANLAGMTLLIAVGLFQALR